MDASKQRKDNELKDAKVKIHTLEVSFRNVERGRISFCGFARTHYNNAKYSILRVRFDRFSIQFYLSFLVQKEKYPIEHRIQDRLQVNKIVALVQGHKNEHQKIYILPKFFSPACVSSYGFHFVIHTKCVLDPPTTQL